MFANNQTAPLKVLLCSDIHENWANLEKVCHQEPSDFDFVLVSGDQAAINNVAGAAEVDRVANLMAEKSNRRIIEALAAKLKEGGRIIYIPGNHDAESLFTPTQENEILANSLNVHNNVCELAPGLAIAGFGGSLPTQFKVDGSDTFVNCFSPYPFSSETLYTEAVTQFWREKVEPMTASHQILLMTHDGPQDSVTCNANRTIPMKGENGEEVYGFHRFGSAGLRALIDEQRAHLMVNIHGHCHDGRFMDNLKGLTGIGHGTDPVFPIINPGSLNQSEYGTVVISKVNGEKWKVTEATKKFV